MDPIDDLLTTMKIEDARYVRVEARAPWGISFPPRHLARLVLIAGGSCWLTADVFDGPQRLTADDCFLVRAGVGFTLQDERGRPVVDCEDVFAREQGQAPGGVARAGGDGEPTEIVSSRFAFDAVAAEPLFTLLPPLFRLRLDDTAGHLLRATFDLIAGEGATGRIGSGFVMSRLSDVLFVQALRACCAEFGGGAVGWLAALRDPRLAQVMREMHGDLAHPWTVDVLARKAGMSRSAFAALFKEKAGDTPLGYLTAWRMYRVKTLLRETPMSVQEIAVRVGYDTGSALSRAFLRREGMSPGSWRQLRGRPSRSESRSEEA
ncbi:AraC family transcriptional regulator [Streptomyces sp. NPDC057654]|uniref:AraC family transcriptional regulator n=1 Tax=Streptomyces sp. NPDC057654 TaxID=3346196 RepID=UPI0036A74308